MGKGTHDIHSGYLFKHKRILLSLKAFCCHITCLEREIKNFMGGANST